MPKTVLLILNHFFGSFRKIRYQRSARSFQLKSNPQIAQMTQTITELPNSETAELRTALLPTP